MRNGEKRPRPARNVRRCPGGVPKKRYHNSARFWGLVDRSGDGCWNWLGAVRATGYGLYSGRQAHRVAFRLSMADPGVLYVCHRCDNKLCCNPGHLFLGTAKDNADDCIQKGRHGGGKPQRPNFRNSIIGHVYRLADSGMIKADIAATVGMCVRNVYVLLAQRRDGKVRRRHD